MKYNISKNIAPAMPKLGKGTECVALLLSQVSKDMHEPIVPMIFPVLGGKRIRDAAFFLIIMLVTFAATLLKPQKYVSSRTIQKCVEHVSTST